MTGEPVYVRFESHYVAVSISAPQVTLLFKAVVAHLLAAAPCGLSAGSLEASPHEGKIRITGPAVLPVEQFADPALAARALFHGVVKLLMAARPDLLWIHAGAACHDGRALLFSAGSGQGKSTLVAELLARGWTYLSDEIAPVDPMTGRVFPFPVAPHRRVSHGRDLLPADVQQLSKIRVDVTAEMIASGAVPLEQIYFLCYQPRAAGVELTGCSPGQSVVDMLRHSLSVSESRDAEIRALCELVKHVSSAHMRYAHAEAAAAYIVRTHQQERPQRRFSTP
jgi:hypothetical protein